VRARLGILGLLALGGCAAASGRAPGGAAPASDGLRQSAGALLAGETLAVAYSGYRSGQRPGGPAPSAEELLEDLRIISGPAGFRLIRLYDAGPVSAEVLRLIEAHRLELRVMLGVWLEAELSNHEGCPWLTEPIPAEKLASNATRNAEEVDRAIALTRRHPELIVAVNVGNEALVSWNDHMVSIDALLGYARRVKAAVPVPVTTADNYVVWAEQGRRLMEVLDFATVHSYPAWEGKTAEEGLAFTLENLRAVRATLPEARLVIGEAGWPSVASEFGARASEESQALYVRALSAWAREAGVTTFLFEAFDEDWKGKPGDPLGAEKHWGLYGMDRQPKRVMRER
jgi:exo-beta-1,3-glucanase (GH17 family)